MATRLPQRLGSSVVLVLITVIFLPKEVRPQEQAAMLSPVTVGSRVRIVAPKVASGRITGVIIEMDERSLVVLADDHRLAVPRQAIAHLEVRIGKRRRAIKGMIIGAGIGALVYPPFLYGSCLSDCGGQWDAGYIAAGAGIGALWGAGIGALIKKDRWSPVPAERVRLSLYQIQGHGFRASVSVAF